MYTCPDESPAANCSGCSFEPPNSSEAMSAPLKCRFTCHGVPQMSPLPHLSLPEPTGQSLQGCKAIPLPCPALLNRSTRGKRIGPQYRGEIEHSETRRHAGVARFVLEATLWTTLALGGVLYWTPHGMLGNMVWVLMLAREWG